MSDSLVLAREVQNLRLELEAAQEQRLQLQEALDRQRAQESNRVREALDAVQEELMKQVSAPVAQILTQVFLLEVEEKPLQARDVLSVSKRIVRALTDAGLVVEGRPGESATFDTDRHEPIGDFSPAPGDSVVVRMAGISFGGKRLRRASVAQG